MRIVLLLNLVSYCQLEQLPEVFMLLSLRTSVFWNVMLHHWVIGLQHVRGT